MPKKLMESRAHLRDAMIDTAERVIIADGVDRLTARKLAGELGIAVGTTYNVFRQMDDLISEVNARTLSRLANEVERVDLTGADREVVLMEFADKYIGFVSENPNLWAALFAGTLDLGSEVQKKNTVQVHKLFGFLEDALRPLFPAGADADIAQSARALWAAVHGMLMLTSGGRNEALGLGDIRNAVRILVHYHIAGVRSES